MFKKIGFIGAGNMGSAVAKAVFGCRTQEEFFVSDPDAKKAENLAERLSGNVSSNKQIAQNCDLIFFAVKPHIVPEVLSEIKGILCEREDRFVLCSMATAVTMEKLRELCGKPVPVIRIMPNTPIEIGHGVTEYDTLGVAESEIEKFKMLMAKAGVLDALDEKRMDAASTVSGCGPAFAFMFAEALADGGVACGLPRDKALLYAAGMLEGAAALLLESEKHPGAQKDAVCSPGGTTIQGVRVLEERGFRGAVMDAVITAYEKTLSMQ